MNRPLSQVLAGIAVALDEIAPEAVPNSIAATTQVSLHAAILSPIWGEVNAWGGDHDPACPLARERAAMIDRCLSLLEAHGARDPLSLPVSKRTSL